MAFKTAEGEKLFLQAYDNNLNRWPIPYESFYISTSYGDTHVITAGDKGLPPLIMLHGAGMGSTIWYKNVEALSKIRRVYAVEAIGDINKSEPIRSISNREDMGKWMSEILDHMEIEKTDFLGHSAGGYMTLNIATCIQSRVKKLVLLAPAASFVPFHKQFFLRLALINAIRRKGFIRRVFCHWFIAKGNIIEDDIFDQFIYGVLHYKWKVSPIIPKVIPAEKLKTIEVPTLLLMGDKEVIYNPNRAIVQAKASIPHIETVMLPNTSHCLFIEDAEKANDLVIDFLHKEAVNTELPHQIS
ncbi:alpha/beta hydrolase [Bacillus sp. FJAT-49736]|uniref:alpha/beta fold hydrolase n=1 Tax=Bacillus sp. FJAT-49736 TaxID=2833582 RepID=UPI001BCA179C|nr:alpha/beta hydrolase [Bacillus sp. FJAT-49736]MBS4174464.1 alpha/beta hydrolase [Bacillus sp. FJAT-49736]MBS4175821.1 alpha/beta hydrolase [Bacillus sp. FJAT-49736]